MKKCTYCGKEHPDEATACSIDQQPLVSSDPAQAEEVQETDQSAPPSGTGFIDFRCPACGKDVSFPDHWVGTVQECLWCSRIMVVPPASAEVGREVHLALHTTRLILRRFRIGDEKDLFEIMGDADTFRYLAWESMDEEGIATWVQRDEQARLLDPNTYMYFGLELLDSSKLIALIAFRYEGQETRQGTFTVIVNAAFRHQGYGTEATLAALTFAFKELNLRRVSVGCDSRNVPGLKLLERAGLRREGEFIEDTRIRDHWVNTTWFALLSREFRVQQ